MDGEWVESKMRKMIYGVVAPRVKHLTLAEKATVKLYSKSDGAYDDRVRKCFVITTKPRNILPIASFSDSFEGRGSIAHTRIRSHH